jgi:hypothetical protein
MKLSQITSKQVREAAADVRRNVRSAVNAAEAGNRAGAYAAAERAQHAAHELKQMFSLTSEEIT